MSREALFRCAYYAVVARRHGGECFYAVADIVEVYCNLHLCGCRLIALIALIVLVALAALPLTVFSVAVLAGIFVSSLPYGSESSL